MSIKSFRIKNFRSCRDVAIDGVGKLIALAGRNGAGKTNILQAINWTARFATGQLQEPLGDVAPITDEIEAEIVFHWGGQGMRYSVHCSVVPRDSRLVMSLREWLYADEDGQQKEIIRRQDESVWIGPGDTTVRISASAPVMAALFSILPADAESRKYLERAIVFLKAIRYYPLDEPTRVNNDWLFVSQTEYTQWLSSLAASNTSVDASVPLRMLHLHRSLPEKLAELKEVLGDNGLGLISQISMTEFPATTTTPPGPNGEPERYYYFGFRPSGRPAFVDYNRLSLGTRRVLRIIMSVIMDDSAVMLMEQPEDTIHSGLMKKVIAFLRQNSAATQIILASHSANVFNRMQPSEIRLVALKDGFTIVRPLSQIELAAAEKYIQEDGPLSDYLEFVYND